LKFAVPDMKNPNGPARFFYLIENTVDVSTFTKELTPTLPFRFCRFASNGAAIRKLLKQI